MGEIYKNIIEGLLYLWQLPQNLVGLILFQFYKGETVKLSGTARVSPQSTFDDITYDAKIRFKNGINTPCVKYSEKMKGGISLGKYIIVTKQCSSKTVAHEMGHTKQSMMLGPLYLLVIGLPSLLHASVGFSNTKKGDNYLYYNFYTEKWADKLAKIKRTFYNKPQ